MKIEGLISMLLKEMCYQRIMPVKLWNEFRKIQVHAESRISNLGGQIPPQEILPAEQRSVRLTTMMIMII